MEETFVDLAKSHYQASKEAIMSLKDGELWEYFGELECTSLGVSLYVFTTCVADIKEEK
jgi:hypothetical protein